MVICLIGCISMTNSIPFYFPKSTYHASKKQLDKLLDEIGLEWNADKKVWSGKHGTIKGVFKGFKKPAVLYVDGDDVLVNALKSFADDVGAEIKDAEIEDIRETRKVEKADRDEKRKRDEDIRIKKEKDEAEAFESVLRVKIDGMRRAEMSDNSIRNWIYMELGVDISERFGLEKIKIESTKSNVPNDDDEHRTFWGADDDEKTEVKEPIKSKIKPKKPATKKKKPVIKPGNKEEKPDDGFISYVCRIGNHKACGGNTCTCPCHNRDNGG